MATRIQFRVTEEEYEIIAKKADQARCPSISQFVKDLALGVSGAAGNQNHPSFAELYEDVRQAVAARIAAVEKAQTDGVDPKSLRQLCRFVLREITPGWGNIPQHTDMPTGTIPKPLRASIGKHFYSQVKAGEFEHIRCTDKTDGYGTMIYEVLCGQELEFICKLIEQGEKIE